LRRGYGCPCEAVDRQYVTVALLDKRVNCCSSRPITLRKIVAKKMSESAIQELVDRLIAAKYLAEVDGAIKYQLSCESHANTMNAGLFGGSRLDHS